MYLDARVYWGAHVNKRNKRNKRPDERDKRNKRNKRLYLYKRLSRSLYMCLLVTSVAPRSPLELLVVLYTHCDGDPGA